MPSMTSAAYVRVHVGLPRSSKLRSVPPMSRWLYVVLLCHCMEHLTDGRIDGRDVGLLCSEAGVRRSYLAPLLEVGLLQEERSEDAPEVRANREQTARGSHAAQVNYVLPTYLEWNTSAQRMLANRQAAALRKRRVRASVREDVREDGTRDGRPPSDDKSKRETSNYPPKDLTRGRRTAGGDNPELQRMADAQAQLRERHVRRVNGQACPYCQDSGVWLDDDGAAHECSCKDGT